jgi:hypothetical protein
MLFSHLLSSTPSDVQMMPLIPLFIAPSQLLFPFLLLLLLLLSPLFLLLPASLSTKVSHPLTPLIGQLNVMPGMTKRLTTKTLEYLT